MAITVLDFDLVKQKLLGSDELAKAGFKELYDHYSARTYAISQKYLKSKILAEDVVYEVYVEIWEARKQLIHIEDLKLHFLKIVRKKIVEVAMKALNEDAGGPKAAQKEEEKKRLPETIIKQMKT